MSGQEKQTTDWLAAYNNEAIRKELFTRIADNLDAEWKVEIDHYDPQAVFSHKDGRAFVLGIARYWLNPESSKVYTNPYWPRFRNGQSSHPAMLHKLEPRSHILLRRGPEAIARELERRFLPKYTEMYRALVDEVAIEGDRRAAQREILEQICKAGGLNLSKDDGNDDTCIRQVQVSGSCYVHISVDSPNEANLDIRSLSPELAGKVFGFLMSAAAQDQWKEKIEAESEEPLVSAKQF